MILFWVLSALLVGIAWWFVVRPLPGTQRRRSPVAQEPECHYLSRPVARARTDLRVGTLSSENHDKARRELEVRLLEDVESGTEAVVAAQPSRRTAAAVALLIPVGALAIYFAVGTPAALAPRDAAMSGAPHAADMKEVDVAVERLAARLKENPEDTAGWIMLGRSYKLFGRFSESAQAYSRAAERQPRDAELLADYADVLAMAQGRRLQGEPEKLIARALEADPRNLKALALAGSRCVREERLRGGVAQWERMLPLVAAGSEEARSVQATIDEARALGG